MYSEFDKISFVGMPCPQLFVPEKDSKPIQIEFLLNPMSEFPGEREIPSKDADKDSKQEEMDADERDSNASPVPSSSSSCSSQEHGIRGEVTLGPKSEGEELKEEAVAAKEEDDDGYHTPTSPRNRIPTPTKCPTAPKKPTPSLRMKRRRGSSQARRHLDVDGEAELLFCSELGDLHPKMKKARGDSAAAE